MNYEQQRREAFAALLAGPLARAGIAAIAASELAAYAGRVELLAVLFTGDPTRTPESWDVCVVLPELVASCTGLTAVVLDPEQSGLAGARFGIDKLPALVVLRRGEYVGVIEGMRDWLPFVAELSLLRTADARPPPVAGVYSESVAAARPL